MPDAEAMIQSLPDGGSRGTWHRVDGIDLLRGLSIVLVMMNHVNMRLLGAKVPYTEGLPAQFTYTLVRNGQFAVQMFFVISGLPDHVHKYSPVEESGRFED